MSDNALVWFRNDLRLDDNPAFAAAARSGRAVSAVYCLDEESEGMRPLGGASRWWLHHSLAALRSALAEKGVTLLIARGPAGRSIPEVIARESVAEVFWNRRYDAAGIAVDRALKQALEAAGVGARSFNGNLLVEPWEVTTKAGDPMKVFTPFWRAAQARGPVPSPLRAPETLRAGRPVGDGLAIEDLGLLPTAPDWAGGLRDAWTPGEAGAGARLEAFLAGGFAGYAEHRNRPDLPGTSGLSPHLRFGEISPRSIWHAADLAVRSGRSAASEKDLEILRAELGWREFSYHLLFHNPELSARNFNGRFDAFPWRRDPEALKAWSRGRTGYPIVDAGMRQLWTTGWMHNRVRMIAASFLIKHLLIDWRRGEQWFWDTLVDADYASNAVNWQWTAGTGVDSNMFVRIMAPLTQSDKFDAAAYIREWVPELAHLSDAQIHDPIVRPASYPPMIIGHREGRERALAAHAMLKA